MSDGASFISKCRFEMSYTISQTPPLVTVYPVENRVAMEVESEETGESIERQPTVNPVRNVIGTYPSFR